MYERAGMPRCDAIYYHQNTYIDEFEKCAADVWLNPWKTNNILPRREFSRENVNDIYGAQSDTQAGPLQQ